VLTSAGAAHADATPGSLVPMDSPVDNPTPADTSTLPLPAAQLTSDQQASLQAARVSAAATGKPVVAQALTTEASTVSVQPSGRLVYNASVLPTRVKRGKSWVPIDTALKATPGGGFAPKAAPGSVTFSGGGTVPLVTMNATGTTSLALTWPTALPKPTVSGSTLTFASVLPSVDLKVTATALGGFTQTLVVKTPAAAANPALATLKIGIRAHGLKVNSDGHGNLDATAPSGNVLFQAPAPAMWDSSSTTATPAKAPAAGGTSRSAAATVSDPAPALPSTATTAGSAAHIAPIGVRVSGNTLALTPNKALLTSKSAAYPLFIDPTWVPIWQTGYKQHFDEVQQGCSTAKNFDSTQYGDPAAGDNTFWDCLGIERSYYQLSIPSQIYGAKIMNAAFNLKETYSASCSTSDAIHVGWSGAINGNTTWQNAPSNKYLATANFGPACKSQPSAGFNITSTIGSAASNRWSNLTLSVTNTNESDGTYLKRFATNPTFSIEYDHAPSGPWHLDASVSGQDLGCDTTAPYPALGKMDSVSPVTLSNRVYDADADPTQTAYQYWVDGSSTKTTVYSVNGVANWGTASAAIPGTFISGMKDNTVIDWQPVWVSDGNQSTAYPAGSVCHFVSMQGTPSIRLTLLSSGAENTPAKFQLASTNTQDPAVKFVYALDVPPPISNAPASQTVAASSGTATVTTVPMGAGTHTFYAQGYDAAGNASVQGELTFAVASATSITYSSLAAAFNNTGVSDESTPTSANLDGTGNSLSLQQMRTAGWAAATSQTTQVTIDGANFTLPAYGNGKHDNVLADNQTITYPSQGTAGDDLVLLTTGTYAFATQSPANSATTNTAPLTPAGAAIAGSNCTVGNWNVRDCAGATGTLNYSDGTTQSYDLSVPDWASTSGALATAMTMDYRNTAAGKAALPVHIYAYSIHLKAGAKLASITLPDVSGPANPGTATADPTNIAGNPLGSPIGDGVPALHVMGLALRNTTTPTTGNTWTGAWSAPAENQYAYTGPTAFSQQTWRTAITPSVTGTGVRIHLSNQQSKTALSITSVTVAEQAAAGTATTGTVTSPTLSPVAAAAPVAVTFGGTKPITIPAGGDAYSDAVTGFAVSPSTPLLVSIAVSAAPTVEGHLFPSGAHSWLTAKGAGDHTADTVGTTFTATGALSLSSTNIVSGIDTVTTGNQPTVAVLGDGYVNPYSGGTINTSPPSLSDSIASALAPSAHPYGVVNDGIENNSLNTDASGNSGRAALARLDRDLLQTPGLQTVVIDQGLVDTLAGQSESQMVTAYQNLQAQLLDWGIKVVYTTLTPCQGYSACTTTIDATRQDLDDTMVYTWASVTPGLSQTVATEDIDASVATTNPRPDGPTSFTSNAGDLISEALAANYTTGDHVNVTPLANTVMAQAIALSDLNIQNVPLPNPTLNAQNHWALAEGQGSSAADNVNDAPLSLTGITWGTDSTLTTADSKTSNPTGTRPAFDGSTSYASSGAPNIDTDQSYTVDLWVKLGALTSTTQWAASQSDGTNPTFALGYDGTTKQWTYTALNADGTVSTITSGSNGTTATTGWTELTASFDNNAKVMYLDVNGVQAGTTPLTPAPYNSALGDFTLGAATTGAPGAETLSGQLNGALSDVTYLA
jgi:hypothetical protein